MKYLFSEFNPDYSKYHFPYQVYGVVEDNDVVSDLYSNGFLPSRIHKRLFYLARSVRVNLSEFELSSENRRVDRKTGNLELKISELHSLDYDYSIGKMAVDFYKEFPDAKGFSAQDIKQIFTDSSMTHLIQFSLDNEIIGYAFVLIANQIVHYAYPFYRTDLRKKGVGAGMMLKTISYFKEKGFEYIYLGTTYTEESLYKAQFKGTEYFTGVEWSSDISKLKSTVREQINGHLFEQITDKALYIDSLTD